MSRDPSQAELDALRAGVKEEIRRRRRSVRRALPQEARLARSAAICERVTGLPAWREARTVLAFVPMRSEVQIGAAVEAAWAAGKRVATTRVAPSFDDLELREWRQGAELEESGMLFLQPTADAPAVALESVDLALVPALAVDERGHRIGYGKGFYDRLLPRLPRALRVAVVFDFERVAEVPDHLGDTPVDLVVTDERVLRTSREA